jgi:proteasome lid subunit RPN8/RPN11
VTTTTTTMTTQPGPPHPLLAPEALAAIYEHARRDYPNECCGIVFGARDGAAASRVRPCANMQDQLHAADPAANPRTARTAYSLGAADLLALGKSLRGPEPAKIIYHSHVDVGAYFSDTDQAVAQMDGEPTFGGVEYVVVDVRADGAREAAQFAWDPASKRYVEVGRYPG